MIIQSLKKDFIKILNEMDRSKHRHDHFRNFCEMAYCAHAKLTAPDEERADGLEDQYMSIVRSYKNKDDVRLMPKLASLTIQALHKKGCDFLGEIAGDIEALDKKNGQFFTPYNVSKMMAHITLPDINAVIEEDGFFSLSDPAAGAGCMILAAADIIDEKGFDYSEIMSVQAVELNKSTYHMLFVQLALKGIAAEVIHGNSLTLEVFEKSYTPAARHFVHKHGKLFKETEKTEAQGSPFLNGQQLDLFGK